MHPTSIAPAMAPVANTPSIVEAPAVVDSFARLGAPVAAFELTGDALAAGAAAWLLPEERPFVAKAVDKRRAQFGAGRACARSALAALGADVDEVERTAVGVAERRQPDWPPGIAGAITHTSGYCAAVVGRIDALRAGRIGIDAEVIGRVTPNLYRKLFTAIELVRLAGSDDPDTLATTMFSAKEAYYKAQFPLTEAWVGFTDVEIREADGALTMHPASDLEVLGRLVWPQPLEVMQRDRLIITTAVASARP